jgi:hypothetical protein
LCRNDPRANKRRSDRSPPFSEVYGEELDVLGPLKVGARKSLLVSYSVIDIEILADSAF